MSTTDRSPAFQSAAQYATSSSSASKASTNIRLEVRVLFAQLPSVAHSLSSPGGLQLYALYKYLTVSHAPNTSCPSIFDMTGRAKWQAWDKVSKEWEGKPDSAAEERYLEIVRGLGWTTPDFESKGMKPTTQAGDPKEAQTGGRGGGGMGISVSAMVRPPDDLQDPEDSLHGVVLEDSIEKLNKYLEEKGPSLDLNAKDEYVSSHFGM